MDSSGHPHVCMSRDSTATLHTRRVLVDVRGAVVVFLPAGWHIVAVRVEAGVQLRECYSEG